MQRNAPRLNSLLTVSLLLAWFGWSIGEHCHGADPTAPNTSFPKKRWTVLHLEKKPSKLPKVIPTKSHLKPLFGLKLIGSHPEEPFLFGKFTSASSWYIENGYLQPVEPQNSALHLGVAEDFELQGIFNVEGQGGWYMLLGWENQHGYLLHNVTLKKSGSPWHLEEIRGSKGILETHQEFYRHEWKGDQQFRLSIKDKQLTLKVGDEVLTEKFLLPNYHTGELILGTYTTPYGPKPLKVRSLRIRSR